MQYVPRCSLLLLCSIPLPTVTEAIWLYLFNKSFPILKTGVCSRRSLLLPIPSKNVFDDVRFQWINVFGGLYLGGFEL